MIKLITGLLEPLPSAYVLSLALLGILFLQSGLDKVFNYGGNYEWLKGHFAKSPLKNTVGILMPLITILEVAAGLYCAIGLLLFVFNGNIQVGLWGSQLSALSIVCLFFGQRLAQDYAGAASLTTYFLISLATICLAHLV
ncbi:MAG: DoxX family membrane protein [Bacteroidota bacterium]